MGTAQRTIAASILILALPAFLSACFQIGEPPVKYSSDQFKANFSYEGKPLAGAFISLYDEGRKNRFHSTADKDGWVRFEGVKSGKYKLVMDGPSYEPFEVVFVHSTLSDNSIRIWFYADYCHNIHVRSEPKGPEF
jgi:hypothetical protein